MERQDARKLKTGTHKTNKHSKNGKLHEHVHTGVHYRGFPLKADR